MKLPDRIEDEGELKVIPAIRVADATDDTLRGIVDTYETLVFGAPSTYSGTYARTLKRVISEGRGELALGCD